jgi:pantothenate kinase-related protein Tda10
MAFKSVAVNVTFEPLAGLNSEAERPFVQGISGPTGSGRQDGQVCISANIMAELLR